LLNQERRNESARDKQQHPSEKKKDSKAKMKEALRKEIHQRLQIEQQLALLQKEFDAFKADVGVDQMRVLLTDS